MICNTDGLVQRKNAPKERNKCIKLKASEEIHKKDEKLKELEFTLMEEIVLLELSNKNGYTSLWSDSISSSLRGCILIELALRDRIQLEHVGVRRKKLVDRKLILKNSIPTGIAILDETLKHIKDGNNSIESIQLWIKYLSGESWNPLYLRYQLYNVRERVAKDLVEKGVVAIEKQNFFLFNVTAFPVLNNDAKHRIVQKVVRFLISDWSNDICHLNKRTLALILMAHSANVLENSLRLLNDDDYNVAEKRLEKLLELNYEQESRKCGNDVLWAVFASFFNV